MKNEENIYCFESLSDENIDDILKFVDDASSNSFELVNKRFKDILETHNSRKETFRYPAPKKYPAGKRIKIILGKNGDHYIYLCNLDEGYQDKVVDTNEQSGGIPYGLIRQFVHFWNRGRIITDIASGSNNHWYIDGKFTDGSVSPRFHCSNIGKPFDSYFEKNLDRRTSVAIGDDDCWLIISGEYNYKSNNLNPNLEKRLKDMNRRKRTIHFVRLFPLGGYFISDADGTACSNLTDDLTMEVKRECPDDPITDVVVARDQSWIVLRENSYVASSTICDDLKTDLDKTYTKYNFKNREIKRKSREKKLINDRILEIASKGLKVGDNVTALDHSTRSGDATIQSIDTQHGIITINVGDKVVNGILPSKVVLSSSSSRKIPREFLLACMAYDKYEAAVALYHCICNKTLCTCTKIVSANLFLPQASQQITTGTRVFVKNLTFATTLSSVNGRGTVKIKYDSGKIDFVNLNQLQLQYISACSVDTGDAVKAYDPYKCIEKINIERLKHIKDDLAADSSKREQLLNDNSSYYNIGETQKKILQRCSDLEAYVNAFYNYVKDLPREYNSNFVEYEVEYEHKDLSARGRMFTKGLQIKSQNGEYPRTATLQGMYSGLRAPLVGEYAHDIDIVNCGVALLCSLAMQMSLKDLVPTLFEYHDKRREWIEKICSVHHITESDAKRLIPVAISGGHYEVWKRKSVPKRRTSKKEKKLKRFVFKLQSELEALSDKILQHPKFSWTKAERTLLLQQGNEKMNETDMKTRLLGKIIQYCENEVLSIIHRSFFDNKWIVRAKVFDGLIVEKGSNAIISSLEDMLKNAESSCLSHGWHINIIEKPLHRQHNDPIEIIQVAREVVRENYSQIRRK